MRTIAVASSKGGVGKTTIACCLAWRASLEGRVAAIDLNADQGNFSQWISLRDKPLKGLSLIEDYDDLVESIPQLAAEGYQWCIIDTMPGDLDVIELAALVCDALVVPVKSSIYDAASIPPMVEIARDRRKPFMFVMSDVDGKFKAVNSRVEVQLKKMGSVWDGHISHLVSYVVAPNSGKVGPELDARAKEEIDSLWIDIQLMLGKARPSRRGEGRLNV
jgi:chromosome partitioning protein